MMGLRIGRKRLFAKHRHLPHWLTRPENMENVFFAHGVHLEHLYLPAADDVKTIGFVAFKKNRFPFSEMLLENQSRNRFNFLCRQTFKKRGRFNNLFFFHHHLGAYLL